MFRFITNMAIIIIVAIFVTLPLELQAQDNFTFPSTRPGFSTAPYPIGLNQFAIESGIIVNHSNPTQSLAFTYNFIKNIEIRFEQDYQYSTTNIISLKYLLINNKKYLPDVAILYNYSNQGTSSILLIQKTFGKIILLGNYGVDNNFNNIYAFSVTYNITDKIGIYSEIYGSTSKKTKYISFDTGFFYSINKDLQLDLSYYQNTFNTYTISTGICYRFSRKSKNN